MRKITCAPPTRRSVCCSAICSLPPPCLPPTPKRLTVFSAPPPRWFRRCCTMRLFADNLFQGVSIAALIYSDAGAVAFRENTVRDAIGGFWLFALHAFSATASLNQVTVNKNLLEAAQSLRGNLLAVSQNDILALAICAGPQLPAAVGIRYAPCVRSAQNKRP